MSDNASEEEQQHQMEKIFICDDVLLEVFAFVHPFDVGLKMALISDRFDALVDVHFKTRKWSLGLLLIRRGRNGVEIVKSSGRCPPIPQRPIPNGVIGFKRIDISYVDQTVIEVLEHIRRLFDASGTNVYMNTQDNLSWEMIWQNIWPFINDNICCISLVRVHFNRLRQFSPDILRNCAMLRSIHTNGIWPELPTEDNAGASSEQAVAKWLHTPRGDGMPNVFQSCVFPAKLEGLKSSFVNASSSESVNYIFCFCHLSSVEPFELKNDLTEERLTLRHFNKDKSLLVRCPIVREEDKWANWEKEATEWKWGRYWNAISINLSDRDIDMNCPSEPKKAKTLKLNGI